MDPLTFKNLFLSNKFARLSFKYMDTPSNAWSSIKIIK